MYISALFHLNDDTFGKGEKSQRGTKNRSAYFYNDTPQKLTVAIGQAAVLLCRVKNLGNRTVSLIESLLDLIDLESSSRACDNLICSRNPFAAGKSSVACSLECPFRFDRVSKNGEEVLCATISS